jgi:hypothetical protein
MAGQRSNQLNYVPTRQINEMRNRQCLCGFARFAYIAPIAFGCLKERLPGATVYNPSTNFCAELFARETHEPLDMQQSKALDR